jgi:hypothetical protein
MKNLKNNFAVNQNGNGQRNNKGLLRLGYIFSKYDSFSHIKNVKLKGLLNRQIRPFGV